MLGIRKLLGKAKRQLVKSINYKKPFSHPNGHFEIPSIYGISTPPSEEWMNGLLANLMQKEKRAFLDIGVNLGQTLLKVKSTDPERLYIGFEPNPNCVFYVKQLISLNKFDDCTIFPAGLYTSNCFLELGLSPVSIVDAGASIVKDFRPGRASRTGEYVSLVNWTALPKKIRNIQYGIIKIDVKGGELEVVKALRRLIERDKPILVIEILPAHRKDNISRLDRQNELVRILQLNGYAMYRVSKTARDTYQGMEKIDSIEVHSDLSLCDYVFCPG